VQDFANRHQLNWNTDQVKQLMGMVGGHPFLIQQALSHLKSHQAVTLEQFLQTAPTEAGFYRNHLREHLLHLQKHPELATALKKVVSAASPVKLDSESTYKLRSMGLVNLQCNRHLQKARCLSASAFHRLETNKLSQPNFTEIGCFS
jgi:hypothetical protein